MTGQIMQHGLINAIEVMSEEIDGVIDEFQGEVRCKCLKVLTTLDFNKFCTQILFLCEIILDETREMKGKIETITSVYISEETRIAPWLTSDLWRGLQVSGRM